jgi:hypothetical protein
MAVGQHTLPPEHHYILFSISPPCDALAIRKALQDSLAQSFGVTSSNTYLDILWVADPGVAAVVRASQSYVFNSLLFNRSNVDSCLIQGRGKNNGERCCLDFVAKDISNRRFCISSLATRQ